MIKNLTIATLLLLTPSNIKPYNVYPFGTTFNRTLTEQYSSGQNYAQYWTVGPDTFNSIGGPTVRTRIIQYNQYLTVGNDVFQRTYLYKYTELQTNGNTYTGSQNWTSQLQLDPQFYSRISFKHALIYWDYGWNITNFHNLFFNNFTSYSGIKQQCDNIDLEITTENGTNITSYDFAKADSPTQYNDTFNALNSWKNYTLNFNESGTTANSYAWLDVIVLYADQQGIKNYTDQQIDIYNHALDNYSDQIVFSMEINEAPPSTPTDSYEIIDIPGLMFSILGMPFAWISTAFDLTLFPGTPYTINIAHVFMAIISASIFIFIIKKVIK